MAGAPDGFWTPAAALVCAFLVQKEPETKIGSATRIQSTKLDPNWVANNGKNVAALRCALCSRDPNREDLKGRKVIVNAMSIGQYQQTKGDSYHAQCWD
jgi:hypothetical protein